MTLNKRTHFSGDYTKVLEILQRESGITTSENEKSVLATYSLGPCVAVAGWSPEYKLGFLTHFDGNTKLDESFSELYYNLLQKVGNESTEFDVRIVGGRMNVSESLIKRIKGKLNIQPKLRMNLVEEDTVGLESFIGRDIALDTKTGQTFSYDVNNNPNARDIDFDSLRFNYRIPSKAIFVQ
jgi:chemotaxis receptor (MCP) glutamine deamidase CheD